MRKAFSILISLFLLASGMHVSLDRHYCGGQLADIKISITGKMASCGMQQSKHDCPLNHTVNNRCCEDKISFFTFSANYCPQYYKITHPAIEKDFVAISFESNIPGYTCNSGLFNLVLPPGINLVNSLTRPQICIFQV